MFCRRLLIERIPEESIIKPTAVLAVGFGSPNREKTHVGFVCYHHHTTPPSISTTAGSSKYSIKYFKLFKFKVRSENQFSLRSFSMRRSNKSILSLFFLHMPTLSRAFTISKNSIPLQATKNIHFRLHSTFSPQNPAPSDDTSKWEAMYE